MSAGAVAVLGLGEAGGRLAADLVAAGLEVRGFDPDATADAPVSVRAQDGVSAVSGCNAVLSVNSAKAALDVAESVLPALAAGAIYADLNTALPSLKRDLGALAAGAGARFADVGLLGPIPTHGLRAPALASGDGAQAFADFFGPLGMPVTVVSQEAGDAAALKLVRSVFMKGLAAASIESIEAAEAVGHADWMRKEVAAVIGEPFLERLLDGSRRHAVRRIDEMEAARDLLLELGLEPRIASATASLLTELAAAEHGATAGRGRTR